MYYLDLAQRSPLHSITHVWIITRRFSLHTDRTIHMAITNYIILRLNLTRPLAASERTRCTASSISLSFGSR